MPVLLGRIAAVLALAAPMLATSGPADPLARARQDAPRAHESRTALSIDGVAIPEAQYAEWILHTQGEKLAQTYAFDHWLVEREARRRGVAVGNAEVEAEVQKAIEERIRGAFHGRREEWLDELARTERTEAGLRRQRRTETRERLDGRAIAAIDRVVPRDKVEREWWLSYGRHGRRYDLLMMKFGVRVETPSDASQDVWRAEEAKQRAARLADAQRVRSLLVAGADFGQLAQESSTDPDTRARRGRPSGGFDWQGWPVSFLDALERLEPGALSEPLYAHGGWWLVKVRGVTTTPFADVEAELAARLLARGPEDDEVAVVKRQLAEGVSVKVLPGMHAAPTDPELAGGDVPALSIDGEPVSRTTYATWIVDVFGETFAHTYAEEWLLRARARELGVAVEPAEVLERARAAIQSIIDTDYERSRERWYESLERSQRTEEDFVRELCLRLEPTLIAEKLLLRERTVSDDDVKRRFAASYDAEGTRREVAVILVASRLEELVHGEEDPDVPRREAEASEKARKRAADIVARIRAGADFGAVARAESDDVRTRDQGGAVPGRFRADVYPAEVARAVEALRPGTISEPLSFGTSWLVFQMRSVRQVKLEDVREELRRELATQQPTTVEVQSWRNALVKRHAVRVGDAGAK